MKPLLFVTGFLGSGKTTLLRDVVGGLRSYGITCDVILNDFGSAEIDAATLDDLAFRVVPLTAGCACCESLEDLIELCRTASKGEGDVLLMELNGTADPPSLIETFTLIEEQVFFFPRFQVCTVDSRNWSKGAECGEIEARQLETAAFCQLTHLDEIGEEAEQELRSRLAKKAPFSSLVSADDLVQLLRREVLEGGVGRTATQRQETLRNDLADPETKRRIHQISHRFSGYKVALPHRVRLDSMQRLLNELPDWVLRAKALVKLVDEPGCRWHFERVGTFPVPFPNPVHGLRDVPSSLVCIGAKLDPEELEERVRRQFG